MASIAIDGPAGAGKSTIAKQVAKQLGFIYVDTGAMYRAIAYELCKKSIQVEDIELIRELCESIVVEIRYENGVQQVYTNGENVTPYLRNEEVGVMASKSSAIPEVRAALLELQRQMAMQNDVVMDGRDIGTFVLPNADVKIYLTASAKERANRRWKELNAQGVEADIQIIEKDIVERDERDMNRTISPLRRAEDAVLIDSSDMTIDEVVTRIIGLYQK